MIIGKFWRALRAQINKLANFFWTADPIAQMQYEYDSAVEQLKTGREGLEQYRALVERVSRQVAGDKKHVSMLEAKVKSYLQAGDREYAAKFALELQKARNELSENEGQLKMKTEAYNNKVSWYSVSSPLEWFAEQYTHYYRTEKTGGGLIDNATKTLLDRLDTQQFVPSTTASNGGVVIGADGQAQPAQAESQPQGQPNGTGASGGGSEVAVEPLFFPW
jgi:Holliday junction resolvase RusA-like endonuclease